MVYIAIFVVSDKSLPDQGLRCALYGITLTAAPGIKGSGLGKTRFRHGGLRFDLSEGLSLVVFHEDSLSKLDSGEAQRSYATTGQLNRAEPNGYQSLIHSRPLGSAPPRCEVSHCLQ
jgi:hypothetical protein